MPLPALIARAVDEQSALICAPYLTSAQMDRLTTVTRRLTYLRNKLRRKAAR